MKSLKYFLLAHIPFLAMLMLSLEAAAAPSASKVLMVVSGYGQKAVESAKAQKEQPGYEFDEFAKAYLVFKQHGIEVDVASPKGGAVEADKYNPEKPYNAPVLADKAIMAKLANTIPTAEVDASQYAAVFIVGGKGAMFDLPKDKALQALIADIYKQQGTVAAVCHGPAALVDVKLKDGSYLLANKAVNGFTNKEEHLFGKKWLKDFDFMLEDKLTERGGKFQSSDIMLSHVAIDKGLITGQNPSSTTAVATELVKALGIEQQPMQSYRDDRTLALVARYLEGDNSAADTLASGGEQYHIELVGMYGYYYVKAASTDQEYQNALALMLLAQEAINNPALDMQIAQTQQKLGDNLAAVNTLNQLLKTKPDFEPALEMRKAIQL